ncbi:hypothetical protein [Pseudocnuella soli]|uniref:hypothetical protein n=1 Tax=Pseudocnuella soli TaxID=2502779 RepID=UPI00195A9ACD|nr:hypothetical protein [Pseudocnuella soli]
MAKQKGIFKVEGTLGDVTFYKSKDGYMIREKGGISAERMASDPAFERTRENQAEFGRAGKAGKLLRTAFRPLLQHAADSRMVSRMLQTMMRVVKADATSPRGQRNVLDGELELLENFEFNEAGKLGQTFFAPLPQRSTGLPGPWPLLFPLLCRWSRSRHQRRPRISGSLPGAVRWILNTSNSAPIRMHRPCFR